jgi:anti-sigma factor RsiW
MTCEHALRVQAYFDGELDAGNALEIERHAQACAECGALLDELTATRLALRARPPVVAPAAVRTRVRQAIDAESRRQTSPARAPRWWRRQPRAFWIGAAGGAVSSLAAAAMLAFALFTPVLEASLLDTVVSQHVASLAPGRLYAVESSDRHTVKPWFAGRVDVSPTVADFAAQGYALVGGRTDYVAGQHAAVLAYRHGSHVINVFVWRRTAGPPPHDALRDGYRLVFWRAGDLQYCAVSDAGRDELDTLRELLRTAGARG